MKIAVHLHLYYLEQLDYFLEKLGNFGAIPFDLFVTMVENDETAQNKIRAFKPDAQIWLVENRGYDVGPFIEFLNRIDLDRYDYILKLHTKGGSSTWSTTMKMNHFCLNDADWRQVLLQAVLKDASHVAEILRLFDADKKVALIGSSACRCSKPLHYAKLLPQINETLARSGFGPVAKCDFVAGTIFWARAKIFNPLRHKYTLVDFEPTDGQIKEGTLAHAIERVFGVLATQKGGRIEGVREPLLFFVKHTANWLLRLIYQNKKSSGKHIVKIFRIPVYHAKEVA